ncbi:MAG TPA: LuxR C-terminal-related transcriptional regulator [Actinomycetes bacterium]|nr:LuxR C-terminal-related transcriptional regulator [Actinomycetes bacterium]
MVLARVRLTVPGLSEALLELDVLLVDDPAPPAPLLGAPLTARELSIVRLLPFDLSFRDIGRELFLSLNTVKTHGRSIYRKLGVRSRAEAVVRARELGLFEPDPQIVAIISEEAKPATTSGPVRMPSTA